MTRLNTKLVREFGRSRWQFAAVTATVVMGIAFFQGALVSYGNLSRSYELTYRKLGFGDVWVRMAAAPDSLVGRLERLPGARRAVGRVVEEVRVSLRGRPVGEVMGRMISLPEGRQPEINRVRVVEGRYLSAQGGREALLELSFARAHKYRVGEFIYPTVRGEEIRFRVVGLVQSPEYIYAIQSKQYLVPTPDTFGVMFIPERQAEVLFGMGGAVNEVCLTTEPGRRQAVARLVGGITDRYGGEEPLTREEQPSNKLLMADLAGYRQMAVTLPLLFLVGTVVTTYTLLARLVQAQSVQIGVLRATGFGRREVLLHYLWLALLPAAAGGVVGIGLGYLLAWWITRLYIELINVPYMFFDFQPGVTAAAMAVAVAAGLVGAVSPARQAAGLPPAVAMSQQAVMTGQGPAGVRRVGARLPLFLKMPLRNVLRRPRRAAYTMVGIALGVTLTLLSLAILDSMDRAVGLYLEEVARYDLSVGFVPEQPGRTITRIRGWPEVRRAEPTLGVAVEAVRGGVKHATVLTGLPAEGQLRRMTDESGEVVRPGPGEALLGRMLREKFNAGEGDLLRLDYAQNRREFSISRWVRVGPAISQAMGSAIYMRMEDVQRLFADRLGMPVNAAGGALIEAESRRVEGIKRRLGRMPAVAFVESQAELRKQLDELMRFSRVFTGVLAAFGIGLAFAVVFTAVSISVLERRRELATLRTLGFGLRQIAWFTTVENLAIAAVGVAAGIPLGRWLDILLVGASGTESMSLEPVIYLRTYVVSAVGAFALTLVSQVPSLRQVRRMDLAAAAKEVVS